MWKILVYELGASFKFTTAKAPLSLRDTTFSWLLLVTAEIHMAEMSWVF